MIAREDLYVVWDMIEGLYLVALPMDDGGVWTRELEKAQTWSMTKAMDIARRFHSLKLTPLSLEDCRHRDMHRYTKPRVII